MEIHIEKKVYVIVDKDPWLKARYVQVALLFLQMTVVYAIRTILSVAMVAMTTKSSTNPNIPVFSWSNTSIILSSFYWTYAVLQFFSGSFGQLHGPKWYLTLGTLINAIACFVTPFLAYSSLGEYGVMATRVIQGMFQGLMLPLVHTMLGRWAPENERSWMTSTIYSGAGLGSIAATSLTGVISASTYGWPAAFYIFGAFGVLSAILFALFGYNSPAEHRSISVKERKHIEMSLEQENDATMTQKNTPWRAMFLSLPVWAVILAAIGESWGGTLLSTETPTYLSKTIGLDIESSGWYSSGSYAVSTVASLACGPISDFLVNAKYISRINARRWFQGVGSFIPSISLIWLAYVGQDEYLIGALLIVAFGSSSVLMSGHMVNVIDIAPRYSGVIWGIANGIGQTFAILAPILVHVIVTDETDKHMWRIVFLMAAAIYAGTSLFFILCLSAEKQWWDNNSHRQLPQN